MATRSYRRPTAAERDGRRRAQLEQLRHATETLLTSEGWQRWLRTRSRFHRYSLRNTLLIAFQCPQATHVAGFRKWLELGRCVRKGEKAIRIFAPVRYRRPDADQTDEQEPEPQLVGFRLAAVFDVSQTEPLPDVEPAPLEPPGQPVGGDSHAHLLDPLERHAARLGFAVEYETLHRQAGYCSSAERRIVIDSDLPANGNVATLVRELAHAHGIDYKSFGRPEAELIVESVAYVVCGSGGLETSSESVPYIAGWNDEQAGERITLLASTIDEIARAIENVIHSGVDDSPEAPAENPSPKGDMMMPYMSDTKAGDRVEIIRSYDAYTKLKRGTRGTLTLIDQLGTVHVRWDDGRNLGLVPGQDEWRVISTRSRRESEPSDTPHRAHRRRPVHLPRRRRQARLPRMAALRRPKSDFYTHFAPSGFSTRHTSHAAIRVECRTAHQALLPAPSRMEQAGIEPSTRARVRNSP